MGSGLMRKAVKRLLLPVRTSSNPLLCRTTLVRCSQNCVDPATNEELGSVPEMGLEETQEAIAAAAKAFPEWSRTTAKVGLICGRVVGYIHSPPRGWADAPTIVQTRSLGQVISAYAASPRRFVPPHCRFLSTSMVLTS